MVMYTGPLCEFPCAGLSARGLGRTARSMRWMSDSRLVLSECDATGLLAAAGDDDGGGVDAEKRDSSPAKYCGVESILIVISLSGKKMAGGQRCCSSKTASFLDVLIFRVRLLCDIVLLLLGRHALPEFSYIDD